MDTIKIYRFSEKGFEPFIQDYFIKSQEELLQLESEQGLEIYPAHLRAFITLSKNLLLSNWKEYSEGIFVFLDMPDEKTQAHLLNHLRAEQKSQRLWWSADIILDTECFQSQKMWHKDGISTIEQEYQKQATDVYLPKKSLNSISNIQPISNNIKKITL